MSKKILIMEDEALILDLLSKKLTREGYEVFTARDGEEGLRIMKEISPDLVLSDVVMPKMGGFEVIEKMQEDKDLKKISVIIISNSGQPVELGRARKLGVKDWLIKTEFNPQEVLAKVKKQIG